MHMTCNMHVGNMVCILKYSLLGSDKTYSGIEVPTFQKSQLFPSYGRSNLKTDATGSFKILVPIYQATWC